MKYRREITVYFDIILIALIAYFIIGSVAPSSTELLLWVIASATILTVPLLMPRRKAQVKMDEKHRIIVRNDIAHFRETVAKALDGNAVAQRDVELELLNTLYIDLAIRYSLSHREIRENMGRKEFMRKYLGEKWEIIKRIYDRRHDLRKSIPKDEFLRDINTLIEVMK